MAIKDPLNRGTASKIAGGDDREKNLYRVRERIKEERLNRAIRKLNEQFRRVKIFSLLPMENDEPPSTPKFFYTPELFGHKTRLIA